MSKKIVIEFTEAEAAAVATALVALQEARMVTAARDRLRGLPATQAGLDVTVAQDAAHKVNQARVIQGR